MLSSGSDASWLARRARSADRLSAVPLHWRPTMEALIQWKNQVMQEPDEYPMAVQGEVSPERL